MDSRWVLVLREAGSLSMRMHVLAAEQAPKPNAAVGRYPVPAPQVTHLVTELGHWAHWTTC